MQQASFDHDPALEEILREPSMAQYKEAILWAAKATDEELLPEKTLAVHKDIIRQKVKAMAIAHPNCALREAVVQILKDLPDSIPPDMLLELTRFTIEQWELVVPEGAAAPV
ncbi:MAG: hypothetical protein ACKVU0_12380 [Saprospiraceae bacterium]